MALPVYSLGLRRQSRRFPSPMKTPKDDTLSWLVTAWAGWYPGG
jgi:hypothetical protein